MKPRSPTSFQGNLTYSMIYHWRASGLHTIPCSARAKTRVMSGQPRRLRADDAPAPLLLLTLLITCTAFVAAAAASSGCPADQASALLRLRRSFQQPGLNLPSWRARTDCCLWEGVTCGAGAVTALDLGGRALESRGGGLDALFRLVTLRRLSLAGNDFGGASLPASGFERLAALTHLNLSGAGFAGQVPAGIGTLRELVSLDLSDNNQGYAAADGSVIALSGPTPEFFAGFKNLTVLNLSNNDFNGSLPRSIFQLPRLRVLDVSSNSDLAGSFPQEFPAGSSLEVLNLKGTQFSGPIPSSISNLKNLKTLDISWSNGSGGIPASIGDLASLSFLDLSSSGYQIGELPAAIGRLQLLSILRLVDCGISGEVPSSFANLIRLTELDLSRNNISGPITFCSYESFLNLRRLQLCCNSLSGPVPSFIFSLPQLEFVSLMSNNLAGPLPEFSNPSPFLQSVYLDYNQLNGSIPMSFFELTGLQTLDLSRNGLTGTVKLSSFWKLTNLSNLCLSANKLTVIVDDEHIGSSSASLPQINSLGLACCNMTKIPAILRYILVDDLDLSCNQIGGSIPKWIWGGQVANVDVFKFNLSRNKFTSIDLPLSNASIYYLDLSFNSIEGPIPIPVSPQFLDYSNNLFSSIPKYLLERVSSPFFLNLANNTLHGGIPPMLCNASNLQLLDISYNHFSGHVPSCLLDGHLTILKMRQNQLEGTLPDDMKKGCVSQTIDFNGNQIEGQLPRSLSNCNNLEVFDVGNNNFSGSFPSWMMKLPKLKVLVLRSNRFSGVVGKVPVENDGNRTEFLTLQIIDLASNNFSGTLDSRWFEKLKAMMVTSRNNAPLALENNLSGKFYRDTVAVIYKGTSITVSKILIAFTVIDFSDNAFTGMIPASIGRLVSLRGLNLSDNTFTGTIPPQFGGLKQLESLDLSSNHLAGQIPEALASLTSLAWLNVSYNQLEGSIPQGGQFLTFTNASFEGNAGLCGKPLSMQCSGSDKGTPHSEHERGSEDTIVMFCFAGSGYGLGFAAVILFQLARRGKRWSVC
ncbi:unnamed protein product [Urochloa decumbens]|uniref:Leucine-rich repeat-containing N-terminal plant-type domain-containing protein n=1 Tax=Urochloa decumbens TaxID=240449 RepID=A0ABC9F4W2_9POAL